MAGQKPLKINGTDFTSWIPSAGYTVENRRVYGNNAMTMMDGNTWKDEVAVKSTVTVPFLPLTDTQLQTLMSKLLASATCTVYFFDSDIGYDREMTAYSNAGKRKFRGKGSDNQYYWTGVEVTFEER